MILLVFERTINKKISKLKIDIPAMLSVLIAGNMLVSALVGTLTSAPQIDSPKTPPRIASILSLGDLSGLERLLKGIEKSPLEGSISDSFVIVDSSPSNSMVGISSSSSDSNLASSSSSSNNNSVTQMRYTDGNTLLHMIAATATNKRKTNPHFSTDTLLEMARLVLRYDYTTIDHFFEKNNRNSTPYDILTSSELFKTDPLCQFFNYPLHGLLKDSTRTSHELLIPAAEYLLRAVTEKNADNLLDILTSLDTDLHTPLHLVAKKNNPVLTSLIMQRILEAYCICEERFIAEEPGLLEKLRTLGEQDSPEKQIIFERLRFLKKHRLFEKNTTENILSCVTSRMNSAKHTPILEAPKESDTRYILTYPVHAAITFNNFGLLKALMRDEKVRKFFLAEQKNEGLTPLQLAIQQGIQHQQDNSQGVPSERTREIFNTIALLAEHSPGKITYPILLGALADNNNSFTSKGLKLGVARKLIKLIKLSADSTNIFCTHAQQELKYLIETPLIFETFFKLSDIGVKIIEVGNEELVEALLKGFIDEHIVNFLGSSFPYRAHTIHRTETPSTPRSQRSVKTPLEVATELLDNAEKEKDATLIQAYRAIRNLLRYPIHWALRNKLNTTVLNLLTKAFNVLPLEEYSTFIEENDTLGASIRSLANENLDSAISSHKSILCFIRAASQSSTGNANQDAARTIPIECKPPTNTSFSFSFPAYIVSVGLMIVIMGIVLHMTYGTPKA